MPVHTGCNSRTTEKKMKSKNLEGGGIKYRASQEKGNRQKKKQPKKRPIAVAGVYKMLRLADALAKRHAEETLFVEPLNPPLFLSTFFFPLLFPPHHNQHQHMVAKSAGPNASANVMLP